jgi:hypothetical protein
MKNWKNLEARDHGLIDVLTMQLLGETEENNAK